MHATHSNFLICSSKIYLQHFQKSEIFVSYELSSLNPSRCDGMLGQLGAVSMIKYGRGYAFWQVKLPVMSGAADETEQMT